MPAFRSQASGRLGHFSLACTLYLVPAAGSQVNRRKQYDMRQEGNPIRAVGGPAGRDMAGARRRGWG